jgi:hypothetical protein
MMMMMMMMRRRRRRRRRRARRAAQMTPKQWKNKIILTGLRKQCTWFPSFWNFS